jgi:hypothetical protein
MEADRPLRRRRWLIVLGSIAGLAIIQSVTFTPGVEVRYVNDVTGAPISKMKVTAVWHLYAGTPAGANKSRVLKVFSVETGPDGNAHIPAALMLHPPVFPFGMNFRQIYALPVLYANDSRYSSDIRMGSSWDDAPSFSFLTFQKTSVDETTVKLARQSIPMNQSDVDARNHVGAYVDQAYASCRHSAWCTASEVPR